MSPSLTRDDGTVSGETREGQPRSRVQGTASRGALAPSAALASPGPQERGARDASSRRAASELSFERGTARLPGRKEARAPAETQHAKPRVTRRGSGKQSKAAHLRATGQGVPPKLPFLRLHLTEKRAALRGSDGPSPEAAHLLVRMPVPCCHHAFLLSRLCHPPPTSCRLPTAQHVLQNGTAALKSNSNQIGIHTRFAPADLGGNSEQELQVI